MGMVEFCSGSDAGCLTETGVLEVVRAAIANCLNDPRNGWDRDDPSIEVRSIVRNTNFSGDLCFDKLETESLLRDLEEDLASKLGVRFSAESSFAPILSVN